MFYLRVDNNDMIDVRIGRGDVVSVRRMDQVAPEDIACVINKTSRRIELQKNVEADSVVIGKVLWATQFF